MTEWFEKGKKRGGGERGEQHNVFVINIHMFLILHVHVLFIIKALQNREVKIDKFINKVQPNFNQLSDKDQPYYTPFIVRVMIPKYFCIDAKH